MGKHTVIVMMLITVLTLTGCGSDNSNNMNIKPKSDYEKIETALHEIFNSSSLHRSKKANETINKYINPELCESVFKGNGTNQFKVDGLRIDSPAQAIINFETKLDDYSIEINGLTAEVLGYVSGFVVAEGSDSREGPWKIWSLWYNSGGDWYIEHIDLKKLEVPKLEYYCQLPADYKVKSDKKWPLLLFLHGVGERGGSLDEVKNMKHSIPKIASKGIQFPFIAVSPLCPANKTWQEIPYSLEAVITEVVQKYNADADRIYLTGLSMGGIGTWNLAIQYPERFAAIVPVCGSVNPQRAQKLKNIPIWAFHGADDSIVLMDDEIKAIEMLKQNGGNVKYTVYPSLGHEIWNEAYGTPELFEWLLKHKLEKK